MTECIKLSFYQNKETEFFVCFGIFAVSKINHYNCHIRQYFSYIAYICKLIIYSYSGGATPKFDLLLGIHAMDNWDYISVLILP